MSSSSPDLSIIIPSYNEELRLPATLDRIAAYLQTYRGTAEVS
jgi:glycosyltransferase involved in cell wall biosynthesis